jgi:hypothetical protein
MAGEQLLLGTVLTLNGNVVGKVKGYQPKHATREIITFDPTTDDSMATPRAKLPGFLTPGSADITVNHTPAERVKLEAAFAATQPVKFSATFSDGSTSSEINVIVTEIPGPGAGGAASPMESTIHLEFTAIPAFAVAAA